MVAPVSTWTGCYIGGNVGWARVLDRSNVQRFCRIRPSADGFAAGGQIGCDYQFASNWVIGVSSSWPTGPDIEASRTSVLSQPIPFTPNCGEFGTLSGSARLRRHAVRSYSTASSVGAPIAPTSRVENAAGVELASANRRQNASILASAASG